MILKNMKKTILAITILLTFGLSSYAVETSIGTTLGFGIGLWNNNNGQYVIDNPNLLDFNVMVEFIPYLGLETGIDINELSFDVGENAFGIVTPEVAIFTAVVPIMLRVQYESETGVVYASAGVKIGFAGGVVARETTFNLGSLELPTTEYLRDDRYTMDAGFALGYEWRLGDANYLGLRLEYDLNVIAQHKDFNYDSTGLLVSYRYAFNSKWKKVDN